jgi:hypothetical protein|tara:strand:+ start:283 stop:819 length:537 start_codon:yes stop_codon:yes gene_type:complete
MSFLENDMKRDYADGVKDDVAFFTGVEVEHTPAFGMDTLFVTGLQHVDDIQRMLTEADATHIFFGANHSFNPVDYKEWAAWEDMIGDFLKLGYLCSLDIPISLAEETLESGFVEYHNFIPQLRVVIPYINQWGYNAMVKIDDKDFKATNPGVWSHSLHDLQDRNKFTDWSKYGLDKTL